MSLYVDGVSQGRNTSTLPSVSSGDSYLFSLGYSSNYNSGWEAAVGVYDDAAILSKSQDAEYQAGVANRIAYFRSSSGGGNLRMTNALVTALVSDNPSVRATNLAVERCEPATSRSTSRTSPSKFSGAQPRARRQRVRDDELHSDRVLSPATCRAKLQRVRDDELRDQRHSLRAPRARLLGFGYDQPHSCSVLLGIPPVGLHGLGHDLHDRHRQRRIRLQVHNPTNYYVSAATASR